MIERAVCLSTGLVLVSAGCVSAPALDIALRAREPGHGASPVAQRCRPDERIVIPGYGSLYEFSRAQEGPVRAGRTGRLLSWIHWTNWGVVQLAPCPMRLPARPDVQPEPVLVQRALRRQLDHPERRSRVEVPQLVGP